MGHAAATANRWASCDQHSQHRVTALARRAETREPLFSCPPIASRNTIPGPHQVYVFLTTAPNALVEPIHLKAMPVILTTDEERDV